MLGVLRKLSHSITRSMTVSIAGTTLPEGEAGRFHYGSRPVFFHNNIS